MRVWDDTVNESMFEPFYTDKYDKDRGLDLTMVYGLLHAHQGFIEVFKEPLVGTCVDVYLPVRQGTPSAAEVPPVFEGA